MFIAHKTENNIQSVEQHCQQTAAYCQASGKKADADKLCRLIGLSHDIGKASAVFQDYISKNTGHYSRGDVDHAAAGMQLLWEKIREQPYRFNTVAAVVCSAVVAAHHGGLPDMITLEGDSPFRKRLSKEERQSFKNECLEQIDAALLSEIDVLLPMAAEEIERVTLKLKAVFPQRSNFSFAYGLFVRLILSCLIDADRQDTYEFMSGMLLETRRLPWEECSRRLDAFLLSNPSVSNMNSIRNEISENCAQAGRRLPTGIYELTLPCGAGKTLSSLRFAIQHAIHHQDENNHHQKKKERIIYVLPFTAIIDQNAAVVREIIKDEGIVLEHHSNLSEDAKDPYGELVTENWHAQIIFTTMVQFMSSLFDSGTKSLRRMQALMNAVIIFDEVQAIPVKCVSMFNLALNFLCSVCNATILLCTATQPALSFTKRHLILSEPSALIPGCERYFAALKRTAAVDKRISGGYTMKALAALVREQYEKTRSVLVIVNTKKVARELFALLKEDFDDSPAAFGSQPLLSHLSTNMCPVHREEIIRRVKAAETDKICISTALIEAGVDISFGCVIRSVCGLDSIVQAAGRCNRNGESATPADVLIVNPADEKLDRLRDIKIGKKTTEKLLDEMKRYPTMYGGDLFSQQCVEQYFKYYFQDREAEMDYNIDDYPTSLFALLSENALGAREYRLKNKTPFPYALPQAFRTANEKFSVIDQKTVSLLVQYNQESDEIIDGLSNASDISQTHRLMKKAQRHSINLFKADYMQIAHVGGIRPVNATLGLFAVDRSCYHMDYGATDERDIENLIL